MALTIDEVTADIAPAPAPRTTEVAQSGTHPHPPSEVRRQKERFEQQQRREARVKAD